jgi:hypothetical protein
MEVVALLRLNEFVGRGGGAFMPPKPLSGIARPPSLATTFGHFAMSAMSFFHAVKIASRWSR